MKINVLEQFDTENKTHLKLLDKPAKKKRRRMEAKETCLVISFLWLLGMAFMAQYVIGQETIADIFSVMLMVAAGMQAVGNR